MIRWLNALRRQATPEPVVRTATAAPAATSAAGETAAGLRGAAMVMRRRAAAASLAGAKTTIAFDIDEVLHLAATMQQMADLIVVQDQAVHAFRHQLLHVKQKA